MVVRGCGTRKQGGVYAECRTSPFGKPLEDFLLCPPVRVQPDVLGIAPLGVKMIARKIHDGGIFDVWDWVGSQHYPNVCDFIEEARRFGVSRRLARTLDFSKITSTSKMWLLHSQAYIIESEAYRLIENRVGGKALGLDWDSCPKGRHSAEDVMCAGLWWEDVEHLKEWIDEQNDRRGWREMPSFKYKAARPPDGADTIKGNHAVAVFAGFPIHRLAVIRAEDGSHERSADLASKSSIPVEIVDE